eukprot:1628_1
MALVELDSLLSTFDDTKTKRTKQLSLVESLFGRNWKENKEKLLLSNEMNNDYKIVKMVAPMVRYSKLPFRMLCRKWGCDLAFTPMIIADSFNQNAKARDSEFITNKYDRPLIVQFASNNPIIFAQSSLKVMNYCDGVDINCGCPQSWAIKEKIGAYLINKPQLIKNMIYETCKLTKYKLPISFKIRIHSDIRKTVDFMKQIQSINHSIGAKPFDFTNNNDRVGGLSWLTVHGRTLSERTKVKVHLNHIRTLCENATIPIIANGDINTPNDIKNSILLTGAQGIMCARGILRNPGMFNGYNKCPIECIIDYIKYALSFGGHFNIHHHHLMYMLNTYLSKSEQRDFNTRNSMCAVIDFLSQRD